MNLLLTHMKKEKAPRQLPRGFGLLFSVHAAHIGGCRRGRGGLGLVGNETVTIEGIASVKPRQTLTAKIIRADGAEIDVPLLCRIDTLDELDYYRNGGILHYVLRQLAA